MATNSKLNDFARKAPISRVAVVIPFFQRDVGLLTRCVESVLAQEGGVGALVVVVDDGSPVRAVDELNTLRAADGIVRLIEQKNAGPGAARNRGLDAVPEGTEYVAFLDSDDAWEGRFLLNALAALDAGHDLFFGNTRRFGIDKTRFEWSSRSQSEFQFDGHIRLDLDELAYRYRGDFLDYAIRRSNVVSTSAMVYRYAKYRDLRFDESLFNGQDRLFKLMLAQRTNRVAFTPNVCATEGRGVNIFDSAGWGSEKSLRLAASYIRLSRAIDQRVPLSEKQRAHVRSRLRESRRAFAATLVHLIRKRTAVDWSLVGSTLLDDPATGAMFLPNVLHSMMRRLGDRKGQD